ncbi:MAG: hypothetical protein R3B72_27950 [Polyangiaceae bacterium]
MTATSRSLSSIHDAEAKLRQRVRKAHKTAARRLDEERRRLDEERARALEQAAIEDREAERQAREAAEHAVAGALAALTHTQQTRSAALAAARPALLRAMVALVTGEEEPPCSSP